MIAVIALSLLALTLLTTTACDATGSGDPTLTLAKLVGGWSTDYTVTGIKSEPTYIEDVAYGRSGDRFALTGSADGVSWGFIEVEVTSEGDLRVTRCGGGLSCSAPVATGYLSTAVLVAALRRGTLGGDARVVAYSGRRVACLDPADQGVTVYPIAEPCFDPTSGALIAEYDAPSREFTGAELDPSSLRLALTADYALFSSPAGAAP